MPDSLLQGALVLVAVHTSQCLLVVDDSSFKQTKSTVCTFSNGATVHGTSGSPTPADAVVAAVAQPSAHRAGPLILLCYLQDVLTIPHEQAVTTEHTLHKHELHSAQALQQFQVGCIC